MNKINKLYEIIDEENIQLEEISIEGTNGIYIKLPDMPPIIGLNKSIDNNNTYLSILAEELGHHFTTYGDLTKSPDNYINTLLKNKKENKAKIWAADFLISDSEFIEALNKCISNKYDMCDHFNITNEILDYKIFSIICNEEKYLKIKSEFMKKEIQFNSCNI